LRKRRTCGKRLEVQVGKKENSVCLQEQETSFPRKSYRLAGSILRGLLRTVLGRTADDVEMFGCCLMPSRV
jgi:hypothetical protein